jgi:hypothetical protein
MISANTIFTALFLSAVTGVQAANDWKVPCDQGKCEFDVAGTDNSVAANLRIVRIFCSYRITDRKLINFFFYSGAPTAPSLTLLRPVAS